MTAYPYSNELIRGDTDKQCEQYRASESLDPILLILKGVLKFAEAFYEEKFIFGWHEIF